MINLVHISDIHLGATFKDASFAKEFANIRQNEIMKTLFKTFDYVKDNKIDIFIISGDLFESELIKRSLVENVYKELNKIACEVFIITGNHDPLKKNSVWETMDLNENIHIFDSSLSKIELEDINTVVYGHSWDKFHITDGVFDDIKDIDKTKINLLVAHGDIYDKKSVFLPINKDKLIKYNFDYVALGHIHKPDFIEKNIAYAGSLEPLDFSETGKHGFIKGSIDKEDSSFELIPFSKREFKVFEILIKGEDTWSDVEKRIINVDDQDNRSNDMYRIIFKGRHNYQMNLEKEYLKQILKNEFNYIEFKNEASFDFNIELIKKDNKDNIILKYIERFEQLDLKDPIVKDAFNIGLEELLNSKEGL